MADPLELLEHGALEGARVAVSVSESPDLASRGLTETHLRLVLAEIARMILLGGASLAYGGHIDVGGYTDFLRLELQKYRRRDRPLLVCLAYSVHRERPLAQLRDAERDLGLFGEVVYLDLDGRSIDPATGREPGPQAVDADEARASLTAMRQFMTDETQARILIGGRRSGYQGAMPGLLEEARSGIEARRPLYLAGGFGGITADIASLVGLDPDHVFWPSPGSAPDAEVASSLADLGQRLGDWSPQDNGLDEIENRRLAASHRPGEIASLVSIGLLRLHAAGKLPADQIEEG